MVSQSKNFRLLDKSEATLVNFSDISFRRMTACYDSHRLFYDINAICCDNAMI